jgi:hypothetical protein
LGLNIHSIFSEATKTVPYKDIFDDPEWTSYHTAFEPFTYQQQLNTSQSLIKIEAFINLI